MLVGRAARDLAVLAVLAPAALAVSAACAPAPTPGGSSELAVGPVSARSVDEGFALEVSVPRAAFSTIEAIPVTTTLTWVGGAPSGTIWGSADGPVAFTFEELTGRRAMGGALQAGCVPMRFLRGLAVDVPFRKQAGRGGDDGFGAFYDAWFSDPELRLPAGRWRLNVSIVGSPAPCAAGAPDLQLGLRPTWIELLIR